MLKYITLFLLSVALLSAQKQTKPAKGKRPLVTYSISGTINGTYAATLKLSGPANATAGTDSGGNYTFAGLANGTYTVTPSETGYTFSPASQSVTVNGGNVVGVNFSSAVIPPPPPPPSHGVDLAWNASTSPNIAGYKVYRSLTPGTAYTLITQTLVPGTWYTDTDVQAGLTYYYVTTAVDSTNSESGYSNEASAAIPTP